MGIYRVGAVLVLQVLYAVAASSLALAGGFRLGIVQLAIPPGAKEETKIAGLIMEDVLPANLESALSQRYGVSPLIRLVSQEEAKDTEAFIARARASRSFDILILPEAQQIGADTFYKFRVADLRDGVIPGDANRVFTAMPEGGLRSVEAAFRATSERIAGALLGRSSNWRSSVRSAPEGLVQIWCIVPAAGQSVGAELMAADLTIGLPFALALVGKKSAPTLAFAGLGHRDYYFECRSLQNQSSVGGGGAGSSRQLEGAYVLSGEIVNSSASEVWLRLFVEDKTVGQTMSLAPVALPAMQNGKLAPLDSTQRQQIAEQVLDSFISTVKRN